MQLLTLDAETFYAKDYSLSKLTTEQYITDDRFEVIGVSTKINNEPAQWFSGTFDETKAYLNQFDWDDIALVNHNSLFDSSILGLRFGIHPKKLIDTLSMSRAIHGIEVGGSLAKLAEHYQLGVKGTEVINALGKRKQDFTTEELARYGEYCKNDTELTYKLFYKLLPHFTKSELDIIDITLKMATRPLLELDKAVLTAHLADVQAKKQALMDKVIVSRKELMSNVKLAQLLIDCGVEPPMKLSPTTGKPAYAFAKTDEGFKALLDSDNLMVQTIVAARLGVKSTLEETRCERVIGIAERNRCCPFPLKYYSAATGRWAGADKINVQNFPRKSPLKRAFKAPEGYVILGADLKQIELRVGLWLSSEWEKLDILAGGLDLYKVFASEVLGVAYDEVTEDQRFIAKTSCIAEGQLVLTPRGLVPIENILVDDRVWDGVEWVSHDGVIYQGERDVITYQGLTATTDHIIFTQTGETRQFGDAANLSARLATTGDDRRPLKFMGDNQYRDTTNSEIGEHKDTCALRLWQRAVGVCRGHYQRAVQTMQALCNTNSAPKARSSDCLGQGYGAYTKTGNSYATKMLQSYGQRLRQLRRTRDSVFVWLNERVCRVYQNVASLGFRVGGGPNRQQWTLCSRELAYGVPQGTDQQSSKYDVDFVARGNASGSGLGRIPLRTESNLQVCSAGFNGGTNYPDRMGLSGEEMQELAGDKKKVRVYDILNAGPRHRFTVSNVLVHNCLSLVFGVGAAKLQAAILSGIGLDVGIVESKRIVEFYRDNHPGVRAAWSACGNAIKLLTTGGEGMILTDNLIKVEGRKGIRLPSGLYLKYPELQYSEDAQTRKREYKYKIRSSWDRLYSGKCFNNITQATARCIFAEALPKINKHYPIVLLIHDAAYVLVPEVGVEEAKQILEEIMCQPPDWMPDIPLEVEFHYGRTLFDC